MKYVWRIPVLTNLHGEIVKVWKPREWEIDIDNDYYETEEAMNAYNSGDVDKRLLTKGIRYTRNINLIVRKDDGYDKEETTDMFELLSSQPTVRTIGKNEEMDNFLEIIANRNLA